MPTNPSDVFSGCSAYDGSYHELMVRDENGELWRLRISTLGVVSFEAVP